MDDELSPDASPGDNDGITSTITALEDSTADVQQSDDFGLTKQGYYVACPAGECCISDTQENGFIAKISPIFNTETNDLDVKTDQIWQYDEKTGGFLVVFKTKETGKLKKPSIECPLLCSNFISNYYSGL